MNKIFIRILLLIALSTLKVQASDICKFSLESLIRFTPEQHEWLQQSKFHPQSSGEVLTAIRNSVISMIEKGITPAVIFDLDETGLDNRHAFHDAIYGAEGWLNSPQSTAYPKLNEALLKLDREMVGESTTETFFHAGLDINTPEFKALNEFWRSKFFSNDFIGNYAHPFPGFVNYVSDLHRLGANIFYLTARNEPTQGIATRKVLNTLGLLKPERTTLIMKTNKVPTLEYKRSTVEQLKKSHAISALFDNDAEIITHLRTEFSDLNLVFVQTHFEKTPTQPVSNVFRIHSWDKANRPVIVFTAGPPGSGKSSFLKAAIQAGTMHPAKWQHSGPDILLYQTPEFVELAKKEGVKKAMEVFRPASLGRSDQALLETLHKNIDKNIYYESTMTNRARFTALIEQIRRQHPEYIIYIAYFSECNLDVLKQRTQLRVIENPMRASIPESDLIHACTVLPDNMKFYKTIVDGVLEIRSFNPSGQEFNLVEY